uniref:Uncharacterized protein n=1 Tax=Opuntia streptacantha TaxID=393608 RepID=A0A7C9ESY5_OPUST
MKIKHTKKKEKVITNFYQIIPKKKASTTFKQFLLIFINFTYLLIHIYERKDRRSSFMVKFNGEVDFHLKIDRLTLSRVSHCLVLEIQSGADNRSHLSYS